MVFDFCEPVKRFLQIAIILGRGYAGQDSAVLEALLMKQSIYNFIDHLRYGGVAVSGLLLLVVIVAELIGDPVLLLGFPFLGDLEVFEAFVLKEFVLGNVLG